MGLTSTVRVKKMTFTGARIDAMNIRAVVIAVSLSLALAGCGGGDDPRPKSSASPTKTATVKAEPQTVEAAKAFATETSARIAAQDFGGAWDQWDKASKTRVNRDDYVKYGETCDIGGVPVTVDDIRLESETKATVRLEAMGFKQARTLLYEDGAWRLKVTDDTLQKFDKGADGAIAQAKTEGFCG